MFSYDGNGVVTGVFDLVTCTGSVREIHNPPEMTRPQPKKRKWFMDRTMLK